MSFLFIVDAQLPPALVQYLVNEGYNAFHVNHLISPDAKDNEIWKYALEKQAIIITKDEDFPHRQTQTNRYPAVIWLRIGNTSRKALIQWFKPLLPSVLDLLKRGETLIEIR